MIDYRPYFSPKPSGFNLPVFHELSLHQQIIEMQKRGKTLREIGLLLKKGNRTINEAVLAWLREKPKRNID